MAVPTSFKQQCPSCEAMVPIRDPKLIGRKIDCPKCKYRFIVEEPSDELEEAEDEGPAKKGKGATAITKQKSAASKGAKASTQRRADDDQDVDQSKPKKKQGGSGMLVVGILLAGVAVIALAIGGYFLFSSDSSEEKQTASRPGGGSASSNSSEVEKPKEPPKPEGPRPRQEDITNLLPNDTQIVLNLPMEHLLGNSKVSQALLNTPGSFSVGAFQSIWGVSPTDVRRVVQAVNVEKKTMFSVMRTKVQLKEKDIVAALKLKEEAPINGLRYYLLKKPIDALSTFLLKGDPISTLLLKGAVHHDKMALRFMDPFTVVCADTEPMNKFLQEKEQPKQRAKQDAGEEKAGGEQNGSPAGANQGGPPGGRPGGPPGGMQGGPPGGMRGGPPGGGPGGPPGGGQQGGPPGGMAGGRRGGPMMSLGGGPGGGPGGAQRPNGMPGGMTPPGMTAEGGANEPAAMSSSYMTVDPQLKAVLDQVEKVDKTENQNVLLSTAVATSFISMEDLKKLITRAQEEQGSNVPHVPDAMLKMALESFKNELRAVGMAITDFSESKVEANAAVAAKDSATAQEWEKKSNEQLPIFLTMVGVDFTSRNASRGNTPNNPNMSGAGMQGGPPGGMRGMMGGMRGMQGGPPGGGAAGGFRPPGPPGGMRGMQGGPPGGGAAGGLRPPGAPGSPMMPPGMQPPGDSGNTAEETTGKLGNYGMWTKDNVFALGVTVTMSPDKYKAAGLELEQGSIYLRSAATMSNRQSHLHDLAAAMQAYFDEKGHFPQGAKWREHDTQRHLEWRPDQRISWMAELLPYLGNGEFKDIKPDYGEKNKTWYEDPNNIKAGMAVIPHFVAPPAKPENEFYYYVTYPNLPVKEPTLWAATHFVGMAGVGFDAAEYRADDPATAKLRGVFGYDRVTKKADIKDGLEQTIVLIQVPPEPKAPWIAGGGSTVRGVSEDLECVKPFVCTEYEGKRGTFAIMADGKVRFIPANIDPKTFKAMCTIAGDDKIRDLAKVAPEVLPPEEQSQAELKAEEAKPAVPKSPEPQKPIQPSAPKEPAAPPDKK